jgi:hypothetical protein
MANERVFVDRLADGLQRGAEALVALQASEQYRRKLRVARYSIGLGLIVMPLVALVFWYFRWPPSVLVVVLFGFMSWLVGYFPRMLK